MSNLNQPDLTNREGELRTAVYEQIDNRSTKNINSVYTSETDNGVLAEIESSNGSYSAMLYELTCAARGLTEESDNVSILYVQPSTTSEDRVAEVKITNPDFSDMSECEQRVRVAHGLSLL